MQLPKREGKDERGVGYVKSNAIAGRRFASWSEMEAHLAAWTPPFITARDLLRRVGADCAIEVDANVYSVPWRLSTLRAGYTDGIHRLDPAQQARLRRTLKL